MPGFEQKPSNTSTQLEAPQPGTRHIFLLNVPEYLLEGEAPTAVYAALAQAADAIKAGKPVDGLMFDHYTGVVLYGLRDQFAAAFRRDIESNPPTISQE